jgi:hypothetical protein
MRKACLECPNLKACHPENDVILFPKQENTIQVEWNTPSRTPEEEIQRTVKILRHFKGLPEPKVSRLADLYVGNEEKKQGRLAYAARQAENIERRLKVSPYGISNPHSIVLPGDTRITEEAKRELAEFDRNKRRNWMEAELRSIENRG